MSFIKNHLIFLTTFILFLVGSANTIASADSGLQNINFQLRWHHQFQFAGYYAAIEKGYYREAGFNVTLKEGAPGITPVEEVLAGRAQYAEANSELLFSRLQGKPLVALAAIFQHSPSILLTLKQEGITTPHGLIRKKIMLLNSLTDADFYAMFLHEGIKPDSINIVPSSYNFEDLISGKVAAFNSYLTNEPFILQQRGIEYNVINPSSYGIDFYSDILFTTEQEVTQHPEQVEAFRRATLKGWQYAMSHTDEIIDLLISKYLVPKTKAHLQFEANAMRSLILPELIVIGHMNPGRWQRMADAFREVDMVENTNALNGFIYKPNSPYQIEQLKKTLTVVSVINVIIVLSLVGLLLGWFRLKKEIKLRKLAEENVRQLAYYDALTGIANRNSFIPYAHMQLHTADRNQQKVAVCFFDLNNFKNINDEYGHSVGDAVLKHVANAISSVIRESDMVARIGGDEFVVLLTAIHGIDDTAQTIKKIQNAIAQIFYINAHELSITISAGFAIFPDNGEEIDSLLSKADAAMYRQKHLNRVSVNA